MTQRVLVAGVGNVFLGDVFLGDELPTGPNKAEARSGAGGERGCRNQQTNGSDLGAGTSGLGTQTQGLT